MVKYVEWKNKNEKIICFTPTPGKNPIRIDKWKYDLISDTILNTLKIHDEGVLFKELPELISNQLSNDELDKIGSIMWYTTTVKLDLEYKKAIRRVVNSQPQRLILNKL